MGTDNRANHDGHPARRRPGLTTSRAVAADIVRIWLDTGKFPDRLLADVVSDRAFVMEVVYGIARWLRLLDAYTGQLTDRVPDRLVRPPLLVGLYQLLVMTDVPDHAAVHETVEAYKALAGRKPRATAFINGVLRQAVRKRSRLKAKVAGLPLPVRESHPDLLVSRWTSRFGPEATQALCAWNNSRPCVTLRVGGGRGRKAAFAEKLQSAGIETREAASSEGECLVLLPGTRVTDVPGFAEGLFSVQDASTLHAVRLLDPQPGERILDACAAPGGKTALIAERMAGSGVLWAVDRSEKRLVPLRENLERLRHASVRIRRLDASREDLCAALGGVFDRILLDVPCTNTGVIRRRPDARWRFSESAMADSVALQRGLLTNAAGALRPGGVMVYSTCSLEPEEGQNLVSLWLEANPGFDIVRSVELFPPESGTDGAYAALIRRRA